MEWVGVRCFLVSLVAVGSAALAAPSDEVSQPVAAIRSVAPEYPAHALRNDIEGTARVLVQVLAEGRVGEVRLQRSSGSSDLDAAAVDAARKSEFRAARTASGQSVDAWVVVAYRFRLE